MKRFLIAAALAAALIVPATASADRPSREIGTPGTPNCAGQTTAFVTHDLADLFGVNGFAGVAGSLGLTVDELHALIDEFCTTV